MKKKEKKGKIAENSFMYLMAMIIPNAAGFFILPVYTRYISPEEYGIYYLTSSIIGVMAVLSSMGLGAFYLRTYEAAEDKKKFNGTIYWSMALWNILLFVLSQVFVPLIIKELKISVSFYPYMFLALLTQLFNSMEIIPMRAYRVRGEVRYYFYRILFKTLISVSLGLLFVIGLKMGVLGRYYAELINSFVFAVVFVFYMRRNSNFIIDKDLLNQAVKFSLPIVPSDLIEMSTPMLVNLIIERVLSMSMLGVYSVAVTMASVIHIVEQSIFMSVEPVLYSLAGSEEFPKLFKKYKDITVVLVSIICVGAGLYVREATMLLLPEKYWRSWTIVQIISVSFVFLVLRNMYGLLILMEGQTKHLVWGTGGYLISSMLVNIAALPRWGGDALGWSNVLGWLVAFSLLYARVDKKKYNDMNLLRDFIMASIAMLLLFSCRMFNSQTIFMSIILKTFVYFAYIFVMLAVYRIDPMQISSELKKEIYKKYHNREK